MVKVKNKNYLGKYFLTIVIASILLASVGISANQAFAMGQPPSTCNNRYDGPITHAKIIAQGNTYYPLKHPGLNFTLANNKSYTVKFVIHTPSQSSQGNSLPGTTWYSDSTLGFQNGHCVSGAGPNQDIVITVVASHPSNTAPTGSQIVNFYTLVSGFNYTVNWVNP